MKRIALLLILSCQVAIAGMWVAPAYVGNDLDDSVLVTFCTFDTTYYPTITDADSIIALRFGPDNSLVDSLTQNAANLFIPRTGWYEIHYRGADASGNQGLYRVYVRAKVGGDWRGAGSVNYQVIEEQVGDYFAGIAADTDSLKDTLDVLLHTDEIAPVDTAAIARSVWDDDVVARVARRIGWADTADVVNNMSLAGNGAYACTLLVRETGSNTAVQGVFLRVMNSSETATAAIAQSDANGRALFSLDADEYHIFPYLTGYQFTSLPETVTVTTEGTSDTAWATPFDPGNPSLPSLCRVYGFIYSLECAALEDVTVTASILTIPLFCGSVVVSPYSVSTVTDSYGYWYLDLFPNENLRPAGTVYDFTMYDQSGTVVRKQITVPDTTTMLFDW